MKGGKRWGKENAGAETGFAVDTAAMTNLSIEEYLVASFEYDREWVDGALVERNGGESIIRSSPR